MPDYLLLMHDDARDSGSEPTGDGWSRYIEALQASGNFQGGSAIGDGVCARKAGAAPRITRHLSGFIRVGAENLDHARSLLVGNPVFEAGGTVEIRELTRSD